MKQPVFPVILLVAGLLLPGPVGFAQGLRTSGDWEYLSTDVMQNKYYVDRASIQRSGGTLTYREKVLYGPRLRSDMTAMSGYPVFFDVGSATVDCKANTLQRLMLKPQLAEPGSELEAGLKDLCAGGPKFKPSVPEAPPAATANPTDTSP